MLTQQCVGGRDAQLGSVESPTVEVLARWAFRLSPHALRAPWQTSLKLGLDVIAECVNPVAVTRNAWLRTATKAGVVLIDVEVICSDEGEHRRRVETRTSDVDGLPKPTCSAVVEREYELWTRELLVIDSTTTPPGKAVEMIATKMAATRHL
jgi:hypothetical protein